MIVLFSPTLRPKLAKVLHFQTSEGKVAKIQADYVKDLHFLQPPPLQRTKKLWWHLVKSCDDELSAYLD